MEKHTNKFKLNENKCVPNDQQTKLTVMHRIGSISVSIHFAFQRDGIHLSGVHDVNATTKLSQNVFSQLHSFYPLLITNRKSTVNSLVKKQMVFCT